MSFKYKMLGRIQSGAALLAVLVVSVVMVMLLGVATTTLQSRLLLAQQSKQKLQDQAQVYGKKNQLVYLIATQRLTAAGISQGVNPQGFVRDEDGHWALPIIGDEIRSDGETIFEENGLRYSIQNEAGLIPINSAAQYWLKRYLQATGYNVAEQAYLGDTLADYADPDNWRRPGGAERASYKEQLFSQPANFLLQSCSELFKLLKWDELLQRDQAILSLCSLSRGETLNLNAIPISLWEVLWSSSAEKIANQRRQGQWLLSDADILVIEPSLLMEGEGYFSTLGGDQFQLNISQNAASISLRVKRGRPLLAPFTIRMAEY
jgi:general secretion pathway protein K